MVSYKTRSTNQRKRRKKLSMHATSIIPSKTQQSIPVHFYPRSRPKRNNNLRLRVQSSLNLPQSRLLILRGRISTTSPSSLLSSVLSSLNSTGSANGLSASPSVAIPLRETPRSAVAAAAAAPSSSSSGILYFASVVLGRRPLRGLSFVAKSSRYCCRRRCSISISSSSSSSESSADADDDDDLASESESESRPLPNPLKRSTAVAWDAA